MGSLHWSLAEAVGDRVQSGDQPASVGNHGNTWKFQSVTDNLFIGCCWEAVNSVLSWEPLSLTAGFAYKQARGVKEVNPSKPLAKLV